MLRKETDGSEVGVPSFYMIFSIPSVYCISKFFERTLLKNSSQKDVMGKVFKIVMIGLMVSSAFGMPKKNQNNYESHGRLARKAERKAEFLEKKKKIENEAVFGKDAQLQAEAKKKKEEMTLQERLQESIANTTERDIIDRTDSFKESLQGVGLELEDFRKETGANQLLKTIILNPSENLLGAESFEIMKRLYHKTKVSGIPSLAPSENCLVLGPLFYTKEEITEMADTKKGEEVKKQIYDSLHVLMKKLHQMTRDDNDIDQAKLNKEVQERGIEYVFPIIDQYMKSGMINLDHLPKKNNKALDQNL